MRGRTSMAVAVRNPQGNVVVHTEPLTAKIYTSTWGKWPFVRGLALLWDALGLGMRALMWSAEVSAQEDENEKVEFSGPVAWTTIATSMAFAIGLFFLLPTFASRWMATFANDNAMVDAFFEGMLRLVLFVLYIWAIGRIPEIGRHPVATMRAFFEEFQDRILFGSDLGVGPHPSPLFLGSSGSQPPTQEQQRLFFEATRRYFESDAQNIPHPTPIQGDWLIDGLGLPSSLLEKLYVTNAQRSLGL